MALFKSGSKAEIDRLISENDELRNSLHKALKNQNSLDDVEEKLSAKRKSLSELSREEKELIDFIQKANEDKVNKSHFISELDKKIHELEDTERRILDDITKSQKDLDELNELKNQRSESIDSLFEIISEKENQIRLLDSDTENKKSEVDVLNSKISELEDIQLDMKVKEQELEKLFETRKIEIEELEKRTNNIENDNREYLDAIKKTKEELLALEKEQAELNEEVAIIRVQHKESIEAKNNEEQQKQKLLDELNEKISTNQEIKNNLDATLADLANQLSDKEKKFGEFAIRKDKFTEDILSLKTEFENTKHDISANKILIEEYTEEIHNLDKKRKKIHLEMENMEYLRKNVESELVRKREEEDSLNTQLSIIRGKINSLDEKRFSIEEANLKMENTFTDTLDKFESELKQLKQELNTQKQLLLNKNKELKDVDNLLLEKSTLISEYTGMVQVLKKEKESYSQNINQLMIRKDELSEKITNSKEEFNRIKLNQKELQVDIESLISKKSHLEKELWELLNRSTSSFKGLEEKSKLLGENIISSEKHLDKITEELETKNEHLISVMEDITKSEIQREEAATKISQLIALEKTFQVKIDGYRQELDDFERKNSVEINDDDNIKSENAQFPKPGEN